MTIKTEMEGFVSDLLTLVGFHKTVDVAGSESGTSLLRSDTGVRWAIHEKRPMACIICFTKKQLIRLIKIKDNIFHPKSIFYFVRVPIHFVADRTNYRSSQPYVICHYVKLNLIFN